MHKTVVIDIVGLSQNLIGAYTPFLAKYIQSKQLRLIKPMLPAVTTAVQSTYLTGQWPTAHGIVGNGWYDRTDAEVKFWKQSNKLVLAEKIWDKAKKEYPRFTCAQLFWWYNMYSSADYSVTPRPNYLADGRKAPDCYAEPASLRDALQQQLGIFPLFQFWGPGANIKSTQWIADASMFTDDKYDPTLTLIYLPHLDYCLQKFGPNFSLISKELNKIDNVVKQLVQFYENKNANIILLSEYGIAPVDTPIHVNRILRHEGLLQNGGVQMSFVQDDDAQTLQKMQVFDRFSVGMPVFWNGEAYRIDARLRYRVRDGKLTFWFELIRPDKVLEAATTTLIQIIREKTGNPFFFGEPFVQS